VFERDVAPGNGDETAEARLTGQEIVTGNIKAISGDVVTDSEQLALGVIEKSHVHNGRQSLMLMINCSTIQGSRRPAIEQLRKAAMTRSSHVTSGEPVGRLLLNCFEDPDRLDPAMGKIEERKVPVTGPG